MADLATVERAFMNAHRAGDARAAGILAAEVKRLRSAPPQDVAKAPLPDADPQRPNVEGKSNRELSWADTGKDAVQSLGSGLVRGVTGLVGLPGDIGRLAIAGMGKLNNDDPAEIARLQQSFPIPSSEEVTSAVERNVTGPLHESRSTSGDYAQTIGEFAPAALSGPGGLIRKTALTVLPAVASQAAGDIPGIKGTAAEPYFRFGGAISGGIAANARKGTNLIKEIGKDAPSQSQIKQETNALYSALDNGGVKYDSIGYDNMLTGLASKLQTFRARKAPLSHDTLDYLATQKGKSPSFRDMEDMRQEATTILREHTASNTDKAAARIIVSELTKFAEKSALITNGSIPANQVAGLAAKARELARRNIIAKHLNEISRKAPNYVAGTDSGIKNQIKSYLNSGKGVGLSDAEKMAFEKLVRREGIYNLLSTAGGRMNLSIGPSVAAAIGALLGGPAGAIIGAGTSAATHLAARKVSEIISQKALDNALKVVLAGPKAQQAAVKTIEQRISDARKRTGISSVNAGKDQKSKENPVMFTDAEGNQYGYDGKLLNVSP